jgi:hypothetical protein
MTPVEYARIAEKCRDEADAMAPSPERDELLKKAKLFESYAKMENWAALLDTEPNEKRPFAGRARTKK